MNFSVFHDMDIVGHRDIDFFDIRLETDTALYVDPERIALSNHPVAHAAIRCIDDFFQTMCQAAQARDEAELYHLLSYGREPNETHLGLSAARSCGRGTSPEILMPIVRDMIQLGLFENELVTQLGDLHLWTPNFGYDRLSDLVTNIIRSELYDYTIDQYDRWGLSFDDVPRRTAPMWDSFVHEWRMMEFPLLLADNYPTLLVPKQFVGRGMLSSPGTLLQKYALRYRQQEHLDECSSYCHRKTDRKGNESWKPPTKKELRSLEIRGQAEKAYLLQMGYRHPQMVNELHADHRFASYDGRVFMSDHELDVLLYSPRYMAV